MFRSRAGGRRRVGFSAEKAVRTVAGLASVAIALKGPVGEAMPFVRNSDYKQATERFVQGLANQKGIVYFQALVPSGAAELGIALKRAAMRIPRAVMG